MALKFKVADLPPDGAAIPLDISAVEFKALSRSHEHNSGLELAAPLTGRLKIEPARDRVVVRGGFQTVVRLACSRCLEEYEQPVDEEVVVVFSPAADEESLEEVEIQDLNEEYYHGDEIDLWPMLEEQLMLSLPIKSLCREDCLGLCPGCGENRNTGSCRCRSESGDSKWEALRAIRDKLPNR